LLQFHHIIPYATEQHFRVEDMVALCPNHHDLANAGAINEDEQRSLKIEPYNCVNGYAGGQLAVDQRDTHVTLGTHRFRLF
jgi:hypothetical protein